MERVWRPFARLANALSSSGGGSPVSATARGNRSSCAPPTPPEPVDSRHCREQGSGLPATAFTITLMTRVLLAEDDAAISEPLARALRREGYDVMVRSDGPSALAAGQSGVDLV